MDTNIVYAAHQPNYLPYLGLFYKIWKSDIFVFLDDVQYTKSSGPAHERNIVSLRGVKRYIKVPIRKRFKDPINKVRINYDADWPKRDIELIEACYKHTPYYEEVFAFLLTHYAKRYDNLADFNIDLIEGICVNAGIDRRFIRSSNLAITTTRTQRLIDIGKTIGADEYYSGLGAKAYIDSEAFATANIHLSFTDYRVENYAKPESIFIADLSVIDYLFCYGFDFSGLNWGLK